MVEGYRLSPQQRRLWGLQRTGGAAFARCTLDVEGPLDREAFERALQAVVVRHEILRTSFESFPGLSLPLQVVHPPAEPLGSLEQLAPDRHRVRISLPALCSDARGLLILAREIARAYDAALREEEMLPAACQYADLAEGLCHLLESRPAAVPDFSDLAVRSADGAVFETVRVDVPGDARRLSTLAGLLACWQVLVARVTGEERILIAALADGRRFEGLDGAPGLFERALPVVAEIAPGRPFREVARAASAALRRVEEEQEGFLWEDGSFAAFAFESRPGLPVEMEAGGARFIVREAEAGIERFHLKLVCEERDGGPAPVIVCPAGLLPEDELRRWAERLACLAAAAAASPGSPVRDLDVVGEAERRQVLAAGRPEVVDLGARPLHQLFAEQADRTPDRVAIESEDGDITFRELASRVAALAAHLRRLEVGPEMLVAVEAERSPEMVTRLLAVLAAGGAWLPLEPDLPPERRAFLLEDSRAGAMGEGDRGGEVPLDSLAYVIYTSGSTGRPKGVEISHGAIVNRLLWMQRAFPLEAGDRVLHKTPAGFDASIWEIFLPLITGARLVLARPGEHRDPAALVRTLRDREITVLQGVPSLLAALLEEPGLARCAALRRVFSGGEALPGALRDGLLERLERLPAAGLVNLYGPTETAIDATFHPCARGEDGESVPIGRPLSNVRVAVLDELLRPVPWGTAGELCVAGAGLARGYRGRADLTAERFLPDPWSPAPGDRLYRTGDLARLRRDGAVEILGRRDRQLKIRGVRVEPEEIEAALARHPAVRRAAVAPRPDAAGTVLVAWVAVRGEVPAADLRAFLAERLPEPMVPGRFAVLDELPLTSSGKVDLRALPDPGDREDGQDPVRTVAEELLAGIWCDLLGIGRVGRDSHFFALGGHSLLATQMVSRVRRVFRRELTVGAVFDHPTLAALAARIDALGADAAPPLPPTPGPRPAEPPLSFAQQRLWFLEQMGNVGPAYHLPVALRVRGALRGELLPAVFAAIARRHEALRTTFALRDGAPVQVIGPPREVPVPVVDLSGLEGAVREEEAGRLVAGEGRHPFDLERGPLLRVRRLLLGREEQIVLLTLHHIVSDGWSMGLLTREMGELYHALSGGHPARLPDLPLQYADFALWQRRWLQGEALDRLLAEWTGRLAGHPPLLELPADRARPAVKTFRGGRLPFRLPGPLADRLRAFGLREGTTLFMTLLGLFQVWLHRITGETDMVVGSPIAGRNRAEIEDLIGFFANTLVLRSDLSGDPAWSEVAGRVREVTLHATAWQDLPFERLVEAVRPERGLGHTPLFQIAFVFQNAPAGGLAASGLALEPLPLDNGTSKFDLTLEMTDEGSGLSAVFEHSADLFDGATVRRMEEAFRALLEGALDEPGRPVSELSLLGAAERRLLLAEGAAESGPAECLHTLFERQAAAAPERVAVVSGGLLLTYGELDRRASRLARHLRRLGVGPETLVALGLERSPEAIEAILGILKAGAAYVPLDPTYPAERLELILRDSNAPVLVTRRSRHAAFPAGSWRPVCVDGDLADGSDDAPPAVPSAPDHLAYVIYTSGSTGRPKGVLVTHANASRLFAAARPRLGFGADDVWTLFHSLAFDFSVWEIWGPLLHGGRLVIVPEEARTSPEGFRDLLEREEVTFLSQTPAAFLSLVSLIGAVELPGKPALSRVVFGGEALEAAALKPWADRCAGRGPLLVNMYGITETTVHVTSHTVTGSDLAGETRGRIGTPLADLRARVMDRHLELLPAGAPGELCIGGAGLARGYLRRPGLTAERFVPDPWSGRPGERLYRSGDLARRLPDGTLQYLGRIDRQVKVRGYRIEPGEVEAALGRHPDVAAAVAGAWRDADGQSRLVAWLVPALPERVPAADELRAFLRATLPEPLVPAVFMPLRELPLTPHGKVDRRALPAPGPERPLLDTAWVAPSGPTEEALAQIWSEVLGVEPIGAHDSFFALGGDSILTIRLRAEAEKRGLGFRLDQLFTHQTVAALAREIDNRPEGIAAPRTAARTGPFSLVAVADRARLPADLDDAYPLTAVQAGMLYHMQYQPERVVYHNVYSYHLRAAFDAEAFAAAVRSCVPRHPILRTSFDLTSWSEPLQLVHRTADVPLHLEDLRSLSAPEQERALDAFVESEKRQGFDLSRPPLVRFALHRRTDGTFNFSLTECHPIFDGWSLHSFLAEIFESYLVLLQGRPLPDSPPPELTVRDFVALEREAAESPETRDYWAAKLRDSSLLEIPRQPEGGARAGEARIVVLEEPLSTRLADGLRLLARSAGIPFKSVLLAAHMAALHRACGRRDVLSGLVSNGRPEGTDGDRVLGLFFNTVPFRLRIEDGTWRDLVRAVFAGEREMLLFRRHPLARLQQSRGGKPLFEILFNYIHFHRLRPLLAGKRVEMLGDFRRWEETDLPLSVTFVQDPAADALTLLLRFDAAEFGSAQMRRLLALYRRVLEALAGSPGERHESALLLGEAERHQILVEWNDTRSILREPRCIHEMFDLQAALTPEAPAVACGGEQLSYAALKARAGRLAHRLRQAGAGPDVPVGLAARRSIDLIVGLLGILESGGAYVPFDPAWPRERLATLLEESGVRLVLDGENLTGSIPESPYPAAWPESAAYVLFTSGSTGVPKGVVVEHRQVAGYVEGILERLEIPAGARFALVSTFTADLGNTAVFPSLCSGGCLVIATEEESTDAAALGRLMTGHAVDVLKIVPSHLAALLPPDGAETDLLPRQRLVLGGEALDAQFLRRLETRRPACRIFNHYGPTETTVGVLTWRSDGAVPGATAPLGRPIPGAEILLLDESLRPAAPGATGEIWIGGRGLARGYLRRPDLTAERFLPHPLASEPGARLYRTGDLARHLPDGRLEFLGRMDGQVKIRGFRIELREIELALQRHPAIQEAAVVLREDGAGEKRLAAFCVAEESGNARPTEGEVRGFLRRFLPDYMLPAAWLWMDALPRTANGKLDRRALPDAGALFAPWRAAYVAPRNDLERRIAALWLEVLQAGEVGMDDNFFDLGGHSLVMLRLHSRLRQELGRDVPMVSLFEHPTIGSLARHLSRGEEAGEDAAAPAREAVDRAEARHAAVERRRAARFGSHSP